MIKINIPNNNTKERAYIIDIIFNEFLGLEYVLEYKQDFDFWQIEQNGKKVKFKDAFFNQFANDLEYLKFENIPKHIKLSKNKIPIIFGDDELEISEQEIFCGIDIFASSFFMLTRWEEYVNTNKDHHNRFSSKESLAYKFDFLHRALVDEYVDLLKKFLDIKQTKKANFVFTTDVDTPFFYKSYIHLLRMLAGDLIKRKKISLALERIKDFYLVLTKKKNDPYCTFDFLMNKAEKIGLKIIFYFISGGISKYENNYKIYDEKIINLMEQIKQRGHFIGLHFSYDSYKNKKMLENQKKALEKYSNLDIKEARAHYLRFELPLTWQFLEDIGIKVDSSLGYSDAFGYRCGTGKEYSVFNILSREKLKLKERPLIYMDMSVFENDIKENKEKVLSLLQKSKFTMLWHNSHINEFDFLDEIMNKIKGIK